MTMIEEYYTRSCDHMEDRITDLPVVLHCQGWMAVNSYSCIGRQVQRSTLIVVANAFSRAMPLSCCGVYSTGRDFCVTSLDHDCH